MVKGEVMVWLANPERYGQMQYRIAEKAVYACPRYRSVYGTIWSR